MTKLESTANDVVTMNDFREGDVIEFVKKVRVGTKRINRRRGYDTYPIYKDMKITAVVHIGKFGVYEHVAYYTTPMKEKYETYFYGSGRKTDKPREHIGSLDDVLKTNVKYVVVGNLGDTNVHNNDIR